MDHGLAQEKNITGSCLSYVHYTQETIHNSNMLGAAFLARTARLTGHSEWEDVAKEAMDYSCSRQLSDGAWYYGEQPTNHWIDNFHTGYNLDSLKCYIDCTGDKTYQENLRRGFKYFKHTLFEDSGRPKYYHSRPTLLIYSALRRLSRL